MAAKYQAPGSSRERIFAAHNALKQLALCFNRLHRELKSIWKQRREGTISREESARLPEYLKMHYVIDEVHVNAAAFEQWIEDLRKGSSPDVIKRLENALDPLMDITMEELELFFEDKRQALVRLGRLFRKCFDPNQPLLMPLDDEEIQAGIEEITGPDIDEQPMSQDELRFQDEISGVRRRSPQQQQQQRGQPPQRGQAPQQRRPQGAPPSRGGNARPPSRDMRARGPSAAAHPAPPHAQRAGSGRGQGPDARGPSSHEGPNAQIGGKTPALWSKKSPITVQQILLLLVALVCIAVGALVILTVLKPPEDSRSEGDGNDNAVVDGSGNGGAAATDQTVGGTNGANTGPAALPADLAEPLKSVARVAAWQAPLPRTDPAWPDTTITLAAALEASMPLDGLVVIAYRQSQNLYNAEATRKRIDGVAARLRAALVPVASAREFRNRYEAFATDGLNLRVYGSEIAEPRLFPDAVLEARGGESLGVATVLAVLARRIGLKATVALLVADPDVAGSRFAMVLKGMGSPAAEAPIVPGMTGARVERELSDREVVAGLLQHMVTLALDAPETVENLMRALQALEVLVADPSTQTAQRFLDLAQVHTRLAEIGRQTGAPQDEIDEHRQRAGEALASASELDQNNPELAYLSALQHTEAMRWQDAAVALDALLARFPNFKPRSGQRHPRLLRAEMAVNLNQPKVALDHYAVAFDAGIAGGADLLTAGLLARDLGREQDALTMLVRAETFGSRDVRLYLARAALLEATDALGARANYEAATRAAPAVLDGYVALVRIALVTNDVALAEATIKRGRDAAPPATIAIFDKLEGLVARDLRADTAAARLAWTRYLAQAPNDPQVQSWLAALQE